MLKKTWLMILAFMFIGSVCFAQGAPSNVTNEAPPAIHKTKTAQVKRIKVEKKNKKSIPLKQRDSWKRKPENNIFLT